MVLALAVDVLVEADALSALARTPPPIAPAASSPTAPTHVLLRLPVFAESYMCDLLLAVAANCGDPGAKVPARPVRFVQPGYVPPMTTGRGPLNCPRQSRAPQEPV